jgi:hypothetical protein
VKLRIFEIVFAAMIASIGGTAVAQAQSSPAHEPVAADSGPKTLLEGILGSTEKDKGKEQSDGEEHLDADRPHFPEATTTVGKGRAILESGYTFTKKGDSLSLPPGVRKRCCGWVYLRIGSSFGSDRTPSINVKPWTR